MNEFNRASLRGLVACAHPACPEAGTQPLAHATESGTVELEYCDFHAEILTAPTPGSALPSLSRSAAREARSPAWAYGVMVQFLPPWFFAAAPARSGVQLDVTGPDRVTTTWFMTDSVANDVAPKIRQQPLLTATAKRFDDAGAKP